MCVVLHSHDRRAVAGLLTVVVFTLPLLHYRHHQTGAYMTGSASAPVRNLVDIYANDAFVKVSDKFLYLIGNVLTS